MTSFDNLIDDILQTLQGYGNVQPRAAFLASEAAADDLQIAVQDATNFEQGIAEIGNELIFIDSVDFGSNILTIAPDGRGYYGTTAAVHATNTRITMAPVWSRNRIASAINETILATWPKLFTITTTSFPFNPAVNTYELPAGTSKVLKVTVDTIGPTKEQLQVNRYSFNATATGEFETGKSITLEKGAFPGRNVNVTYMGAPTEITFGDSFTESGLAESAKLCIKYGACSNLLAWMDSSRLPVDTAQADEVDSTKNVVGTAARLSAQLYQRYLVELETERTRLRSQTPVAVKVRTR